MGSLSYTGYGLCVGRVRAVTQKRAESGRLEILAAWVIRWWEFRSVRRSFQLDAARRCVALKAKAGAFENARQARDQIV